MSSKLVKLSHEYKALMEKAKEIENEIQIEKNKEQERAQRKIRYNTKTGNFTVKIPSTEDSSRFTEVELTLTEDQFDELYEEIASKKLEAIVQNFPRLTEVDFSDGWKGSPGQPNPFKVYGNDPLEIMTNFFKEK